MKRLSTGKLVGLRKISRRGFFTMTAIDHRNSLRTLIPHKVSVSKLKEIKSQLAENLAPFSSALLIDPEWGLPAVATTDALSKTGLILSIEAKDYQDTPAGRITRLAKGLSPMKLRELGADAVKLLLYYLPTSPTAARQVKLVKKVADGCRKADVLFVCEPMSYSTIPKHSKEFAAMKPWITLETARAVSRYVDILKAEFPADLNYHSMPEARRACEELSQVCRAPWVVLSAGDRFDDFKQEVAVASKAGASGFLAGRAIWQEALRYSRSAALCHYLKRVGGARLKTLTKIVFSQATPWTKIYSS